MKILVVADEECVYFWDYYTPGKLAPYELILSSGDLNPAYLRFLVTMARCPLIYVHGNHDDRYAVDPPEGCDCIDDKLIVYNGIRILGLGGSGRYGQGKHHQGDEDAGHLPAEAHGRGDPHGNAHDRQGQDEAAEEDAQHQQDLPLGFDLALDQVTVLVGQAA